MTKTVADLIEDLKTLNPEWVVGVSSDEEGNKVSAWSGDYSLAVYDVNGDPWEDMFSGYLYDDDDNETEVTEENATAIVLWP